MNRKELEEYFEDFTAMNPELNHLNLINSDSRLGKKVALGYYQAGILYVKTDYYTYKEMECFLDGYAYAKNLIK